MKCPDTKTVVQPSQQLTIYCKYSLKSPFPSPVRLYYIYRLYSRNVLPGSSICLNLLTAINRNLLQRWVGFSSRMGVPSLWRWLSSYSRSSSTIVSCVGIRTKAISAYRRRSWTSGKPRQKPQRRRRQRGRPMKTKTRYRRPPAIPPRRPRHHQHRFPCHAEKDEGIIDAW
jgi:hypothetical protein